MWKSSRPAWFWFGAEETLVLLCFACVYSAVMRCCSRLSLWFSSSSFWLWCSSVFPLCRLWISNSLTASTGSGTAFSKTEPNLNWKKRVKRNQETLNFHRVPACFKHLEYEVQVTLVPMILWRMQSKTSQLKL